MLDQALDSLQLGKEITFGEPWRLNEKSLSAIIPILRPEPTERGYVLLQEAQEKVDIEDTGSIGRAKINLIHKFINYVHPSIM